MPHSIRSVLWVLALALAIIGGAQTPNLPTEKPFVPTNRWALVIGASAYSEDFAALKYPSSDAKSFAGALENDLDFNPENVRLLTDGGPPSSAPTSANMLAALDSLLSDRRLDRANLFVFYFSGHGVGTAKGDFLLPSDIKHGEETTKGVPIKDVISRIVGAGLKNVLFITDACRAGEKNPFGAELNELCRKANIAVMLGCAPGRRSYEYPELGHGAFTYFLTKDLTNPDLRDGSGAVWASRLGVALQGQVKDYTERDHGKYAQVPALWSEASTLDVLLAAYPDSSPAALAQFRERGKTLDRPSFANACALYGGKLFDDGRADLAVDFYKLVDQLGEATPCIRYNLAVALDQLGRTHEADRVYGGLEQESPGYWRDVAMISNQSRSVSVQARVAAATRIFDTSRTWGDRFLAYESIKRCGSYRDRLAIAKRFAALPEPDPRRRAMAKAQLAEVEGRWADAIKAYTAARSAPGKTPGNDVLHWQEMTCVVALGSPKATDAWIARGLAMPQTKALTLLVDASFAKSKGDQKLRIELIEKALSGEVTPDLLTVAARLAGPFVGEIAPVLKAQAQRQPYSWQSQFILFLVASFDKNEAEMQAASQMWDRYLDDELSMSFEVCSFMENMLSESVLLGRASNEAYTKQVESYFLNLRPMANQFGYDAELWGDFVRYGMTASRNAQVRMILDRHLRFKPSEVPAELRPILVLVDLNTQVGPAATRLWNPDAFAPEERNDPTWIWAAYQACRGKTRIASNLIRNLHNPSEPLQPIADGLRAYLAAEQGNRTLAKKLLLKKTTHVAEQAFQGMAWASMGDWKRATPLLEAAGRLWMWSYLFIQRNAIKVLDEHYLKLGQTDKHRELIYTISMAQPGNPLFAEFSFPTHRGTAQFAGRLRLRAGFKQDDGRIFGGTLDLTITAKGVVSGAFTDETGQKAPISATVDKYGNMLGIADFAGQKLTLNAKIAPPKLYDTFAKFAEPGQYFQLIDKNAGRVALFGWRGR